MVKFRFLCSSFQILFIRSLIKKKKEKSRSPHSHRSSCKKGPRQHQCVSLVFHWLSFLLSRLHTLNSALFSPSASMPSGPGSIPTTVPVQMPKPSRVQQALAGRHAALGLQGLEQAVFGKTWGQWEEIVGWGLLSSVFSWKPKRAPLRGQCLLSVMVSEPGVPFLSLFRGGCPGVDLPLSLK